MFREDYKLNIFVIYPYKGGDKKVEYEYSANYYVGGGWATAHAWKVMGVHMTGSLCAHSVCVFPSFIRVLETIPWKMLWQLSGVQ